MASQIAFICKWFQGIIDGKNITPIIVAEEVAYLRSAKQMMFDARMGSLEGLDILYNFQGQRLVLMLLRCDQNARQYHYASREKENSPSGAAVQ